MNVTPSTQSILLLTTYFSDGNSSNPKPLTPTEYGRFAEWLSHHDLTPEQLLRGSISSTLAGMPDSVCDVERIGQLMDRGSALAIAMDKWLSAGLWVVTRSEAEYPKKLKQRLGKNSPALFFGSGNKSLLNQGGLALIGSRDATQNDLSYAREIGRKAATTGISIVSGGAKGIDEAGMQGALEMEGTAVGVLADSLLRASTSQKYRASLMNNSLTLVSTFNPEAGFNVGNAMARNKYIYCISDASLAVHSGKKGGTWSGAVENIKKGWVPLWVKQTKDMAAGNDDLIGLGGIPLSSQTNEVSIEELIGMTEYRAQDPEIENGDSVKIPESTEKKLVETSVEDIEKKEELRTQDWIDLYEAFLNNMNLLTIDAPKTEEQLIDALSINKSQFKAWLKQGIQTDRLHKLSNPVRYQVKAQGALPGI